MLKTIRSPQQRRCEGQGGRTPKSNVILISLLIIAAIIIWTGVLHNPEQLLKVTFLDVGQGDAIFLEFPQGGNMLIDGGSRSKYDMGKVIANYLRQQGIKRIDMVLLTHPHEDHVGGLLTVLETFPVGLVMDSGQTHTSYIYKKFLNLIEEKNIAYRTARAGDEINGFKGIKMIALNPPALLFEGTNSDLNNNSIVLKVTCGNVNLLFTGDIEEEAEERIATHYGSYLKSTVIKVPHHGSHTSSTADFLNLVKPRTAIISVGKKNPFRHPSPKVIRRYETLGTKVYRTDKQGAIILTSNGKSIRIKSMK